MTETPQGEKDLVELARVAAAILRTDRPLTNDFRQTAAETIESLRAKLAEAEGKIVESGKLNEQLYAKLTCMCGDLADGHGMWSGHSPVPMYDYALDQETEAREAAESRSSALEALIYDVREYLRNGTWKRTDGVDNELSKGLTTSLSGRMSREKAVIDAARKLAAFNADEAAHTMGLINSNMPAEEALTSPERELVSALNDLDRIREVVDEQA